MKIKMIALTGMCAIAILAISCTQGNNDTQPQSCTVTYNGNGGFGTDGSTTKTDETIYIEGDSYTVLSNAFFFNSDSTKKFAAWNTNADGTGTSLAVGDVTKLSGNLVLYAQWGDLTALELLNGLTSRVTTQYDLTSTGSKRSLAEWSWSWDSVGTESVDYYAEYSYANDKDVVSIYSDDTKATPIAYYDYIKDSDGNITTATWYDGDRMTKQAEWTATYNANGKYLTYQYYSWANSVWTLSENRVCAYAPDNVNYIKELYFNGAGTDEATDLKEKFVPTYEDDDPTTGKILKEIQTKIIASGSSTQDSDNDSDLGGATFETTYLFSWQASDYIYQESKVESDVVTETLNYTWENLSTGWAKRSELYLLKNVPNEYETWEYNGDTANLITYKYYDMATATETSISKQLSSKIVYDYSTDENENKFMTADTYSYAVTRGGVSSGNEPPKFTILATAARY